MSAKEEEILKAHREARKTQRDQRNKAYDNSRYKQELHCDYHGGTIDVNCKDCIANIKERLPKQGTK